MIDFIVNVACSGTVVALLLGPIITACNKIYEYLKKKKVLKDRLRRYPALDYFRSAMEMIKRGNPDDAYFEICYALDYLDIKLSDEEKQYYNELKRKVYARRKG